MTSSYRYNFPVQLLLTAIVLLLLLFFFAVRGPHCGGFSRCGAQAPDAQAQRPWLSRRLSGHGSWAQPLRGMWDPPRPGHEAASPASASALSTTAPPGKPWITNSLTDSPQGRWPRGDLPNYLQVVPPYLTPYCGCCVLRKGKKNNE